MITMQLMQRHVQMIWGRTAHGTLQLTKKETASIPEGLIINGFIQDEEAFTVWLKSLATQYSLSGQKITLTVDSTAVIYRQIETPKLSSKNLTRNLYFNLARQIGSLEENTVDYASLDGENGLQQNLTVVVPQTFSDSYYRCLKNAGMKPAVLTTTAQNLIRAAAYLKESQTAIYAWCSDEICTTVLFNGGRFTFCNVFRFDAQLQSAEAVLGERISQLIQFQRIKNPEHPAELVRFGMREMEAGAQARLQNLLNVETQEFPPASILDGSELSAAASAIYSLVSLKRPYNLFKGIRHDQFTEEYRQKRWMRLCLGALAVNAAGLGIILYFQYAAAANERQRVISLTQKLEAEDRIQQYNDAMMLSSENALTRMQIEDALSVLDYRDQSEQINKTLIEQMIAIKPKAVTINGITAQDGLSLMLNCVSSSRLSPAEYVENLRASGWFQDVGYTGFSFDNKQYSFIITMTLKGGDGQ